MCVMHISTILNGGMTHLSFFCPFKRRSEGYQPYTAMAHLQQSIGTIYLCYDSIGKISFFKSNNPPRPHGPTFFQEIVSTISSLKAYLLANEAEINKLGGDIKKIASHCVQKGFATLCACGVTFSPPMASICLRAGWSMGTIKDRYWHYEQAGDQYVGRTVAGISTLSLDFAVSPAYFKFDNCYDDEKNFEKK